MTVVISFESMEAAVFFKGSECETVNQKLYTQWKYSLVIYRGNWDIFKTRETKRICYQPSYPKRMPGESSWKRNEMIKGFGPSVRKKGQQKE